MRRCLTGFGWTLAAALLASCVQAKAPGKDLVRACTAAASPDGRLRLEYGFVTRPAYSADAFVVSICPRDGGCEEVYRHEDAAQFVARWRDARNVEIQTTSSTAHTRPGALGVAVTFVRRPRSEAGEMRASTREPGSLVSNLIETCTPGA